MNLGILGAGMIVQEALPIIKHQEYTLGGICATPRSVEKLANLCKEYDIAKYYTDYVEMLSNKAIDTIYIAVPNTMHYEACKQALLAGKNVICEKPFTVTAKELVELAELAKSKKLILIEAITNQYLPNYELIKEMVQQGELGDIKVAIANYSQYSSRYDRFLAGEIAPAFNPKLSGGALMDLNVYNIHFLVGLFGKPENVIYTPTIEQGVDVSGILVMQYPNLSAVAIASKACNCDNHVQLQGTEAAIVLNKPSNECSAFKIFRKGEDDESYNVNKYEHRMESEFAAFKTIINNADYAEAEERMKQSIIVMEILAAARKFL